MKLCTMGYGLLKGTHAEREKAFQDRLIGIQKRLDKKLCILDVRKLGSGSRNGEAFAHPGYLRGGLCEMVESLGDDFYYLDKSVFANSGGFKHYRDLWEFGRNTPGSTAHDYFRRLVRDLRDGMDSYANILLCGCHDAYKKTGAVNCHRVILAEQLVKELGEGWEVEHLE